jgi:hypothetical protein
MAPVGTRSRAPARPRRAAQAGASRPPSLLAPRLGIASLRVYVGALFLDAFHYKVFAGGQSLGAALESFVRTEYEPLVRRAIAEPPTLFGTRLDAYARLLEHFALPNAGWLGPVILLFEGWLGVSLVLGVGVRLFAFLGALLMLSFGLAKGLYFLTVTGGMNWLLLATLLCLSLTAAGRIWGLDAWLKPRLGRRLAWIS